MFGFLDFDRMKIHELKIWPIYFEAVSNGSKTFEVRKNDRNYLEGDRVILREWNPDTEKFTMRQMSFKIGYVFPFIGGQVVFSLLKE